jgi:hypothetical protein
MDDGLNSIRNYGYPLGNNVRFVGDLIGMVSLGLAAKAYNTAVESVQKETASLLKRDCRARAAHPGAVDYVSEIVRRAARARWRISQSG